MSDTIPISAFELKTCVSAIFGGVGLPAQDAEVVADSLVEADLRGVSSHGVVRVPSYVKGIRDGSINPRPSLQLVVDEGPRALVDGDNGMGQVAAQRNIVRGPGVSTNQQWQSSRFDLLAWQT